MTEEPVVLEDGTGMVHHGTWTAETGGWTRCVLAFRAPLTNKFIGPAATVTSKSVDCMACLARSDAPGLSHPVVNPFGERVWLRRGPHGQVTECCDVENPCPEHD